MSAAHTEIDLRRMPPMRFTVHQYHRMIDEGIVPEDHRYELIDGYILPKDRSHAGDDPMSIGRDHRLALQRIGALSTRLAHAGVFIQSQQPITIPDDSEPEPDGAIVLGDPNDYDPHPTAADVCCVIEASDSSLHYDRVTKGRIYADAGIPQYLIVNLIDRVVEVYQSPDRKQGRYAHTATFDPAQQVSLPLGDAGQLVVNAAELLP